MSSSNKVILRSGDNERFEVEMDVASMSQTIKQMAENMSPDDVISLPNVSGNILSRVVDYCKKHVEATRSVDRSAIDDEELRAFDANFVAVDHKTLFDLIAAGNYLGIKGLADLASQTVANMIQDMTIEEMRSTFNIKNDFTKEEEEKIRRETQWTFE